MSQSPSTQLGIRVVIQRAGTSKGLFLHEADLPEAGPRRDRLLARLMGSPDALQIDGLGGSRPITSKIAIIKKSARSDADVDYTFAQVGIGRGGVGYEGNCGNISSGVGPFAVDEQLVTPVEGHTEVRIYNSNTDKILVAHVPVRNGKVVVEGDFAIDGVPGTGAEVLMNWVGTIGAKTGRLLPTGKPFDLIEMADGRTIKATLCDAANPCAWVNGAIFSLDGTESADGINKNAGLMGFEHEIRAKAAVLFGFAKDWTKVSRQSGLPMVGFVSRSTDYKSINGIAIGKDAMDVRVHLIFLGALHESIAGTGSVCLAAASRIPDSIVHAITPNGTAEILRIGHPSGVTPARVKARAAPVAPFVIFDDLGFSRTSRRLMDGKAYYPANLI